MHWGLILGLGAVALVVVAAALSALAFRGFAAGLVRAVAEAPPPVDASAGLPPRVRAFAERNGAALGDLARGVELIQAAEMQLKPGAGWQAMEARQRIATGAAMFVWQARPPGAGVSSFRVVDALTGRRGRLTVQLYEVFPVVRARGPDFDRAEAIRYLAELPWAPDAILGNPGIRWSDLGADGVRAAVDLVDGPVEVQFGFDADGDIVAVMALDRPARGPGGKTVLRNWFGRFWDYQWVGGRRIPVVAEAGYLDAPNMPDPYFQCQVTAYTPIH